MTALMKQVMRLAFHIQVFGLACLEGLKVVRGLFGENIKIDFAFGVSEMVLHYICTK